MGLKDEIRQLRGELDDKLDETGVRDGVKDAGENVADTVKKGAAHAQAKVEEGLDAVQRTVRSARAKVDEVTDPDYIAGVRSSLSQSLAQVGEELERVPARYPTLTALTALGVGIALGLSLSRKNR
ncbi:hypothetical protein [Paenirhodobacter populi]|uniref:DUF883 family protein n=1 Tax=Paenirhodobacter populi TaxID=2306993 RepID=A0A443IRE3_9RHOB|nr:hypothetical protein [Sinirhodobacter populi]RWR09975.1 hypothetical protein D2T33_13355 [Sinirhodobacter populi]RWR11373.1 hypothetical protein D2T32_00750 [Sinirhodobacter populi]RWR20180.1 hypothetical protein D2T30_12140 [Sinirhodobacter populi]RWR30909.1 hypothetical protein D2T31_05915 [Sinirhodobacter populi]RWR33009.1 hypothetical protein D2T29_08140 [Sinirhodobacter populi]